MKKLEIATVLVFSLAARAQTSRGTVAGTVLDQSGASDPWCASGFDRRGYGRQALHGKQRVRRLSLRRRRSWHV